MFLIFINLAILDNSPNITQLLTSVLDLHSGFLLLLDTQSNILNKALLISAVFTFWAAVANLPNRLRLKWWQILSTFYLFIMLTGFYIRTDSIVQFFFLYELFLLPSAVLVWVISPNKRSLRSSLYFLLWTQAGSMLVLGGILNLTNGFSGMTFSTLTPSNQYSTWLIWFGFSVKIPLVPFYFWLTKTHVEAVTSFSIFLSGFLVKLAVIGLWKFSPLLTPTVELFFLTISLLTLVIASVAFMYQTDYKKLIAYATVQEMGLLALLLILTIKSGLEPAASLLVVHTILSALFFSIADMLYKRYQTRVINLTKGLLSLAPIFYTLVFISLVVFKGLPFTAKFSIEYVVFNTALQYYPAVAILLVLFTTILGNLFISIVHFKIAFNSSQKVIVDLSIREFLLLSFLLVLLILHVV